MAVPLGGVAAKGAPLAFSYSSIAPMPFGTNEAQSVVLGDQLYVFGGFDTAKATFTPTNRAWRYDPAANHWSALPTMPVNGITHSGIATDGVRYIYYAGGSASAQNATDQVFGTVDAWRYDSVAGTYTALPNLPEARSAGGLGYVGGKLYYFGGNNLARTQDGSETWMLDVAAGATSWVSEAAFPDPRNHIGFATINGKVYAVGGQHGTDSATAQGALDRYDPASNTWTVLPDMPLPRGHVMDSTFVLNGDLVVAGGWTTTNVSAAVLAYDPVANTWASWPNLPEARTSTTVKGISGGRFLFCCGSAGTSAATGWLANPAVPPTSPPTTTPAPGPTTTPAPVRTTPSPVRTTPTPVRTTSQPVQPQPTASTPSPTASAPPSVAPTLPVTIGNQPLKLRLSGVTLRPSTVGSSVAGKAEIWFRLNHGNKVTLVLQKCGSQSCTGVHRLRVSSPAGLSHVSLKALVGRTKVSVAHYRVVVTANGLPSVTLRLVVSAG